VVNTGQWVHVAAVLPEGAGSTSDIQLYVNGDLQTGAVTAGAINTKALAAFRVGANETGNFFTGLIDDLYLFDRALSVVELKQVAGLFKAKAGADLKISCAIGATDIVATLMGAVEYGSPSVTTTWTTISGPAPAIFADATMLNTPVTFPLQGQYNLRLTAADRGWESYDDIRITITSGEVGRWTMDGDLSDSIGGRTGTAQGDPVFVEADQAKVGSGAVELDGNDSVVMNGYSGITGTKARTCMAWIKTTGVFAPIVYWGDKNTAGALWEMRVGSMGQLRLLAGGGPAVDGVTKVNTGQWVHVAAVLPEGGSSAANIQLYVNGVRETEAVTAGTINTKSAAAFRIGADETGKYFTGLIDDVRVYDRALTAAEIAGIAQ
jgi:arabinan endo-1,5-alpha-L-arabinosidase